MGVQNTVIFKSERFLPVLPDECQVNPGRYGAELAFWLCEQLARKGVVTSYPNYEDWGWFLEHTAEGGDFRLCCGNVDGTDDEWQCFVEPISNGFFKGKPDISLAEPLINALKSVLENAEGITAVEWSNENV